MLQGQISECETKLQKAIDDHNAVEADHQNCQYDGVSTSIDQSSLTTQISDLQAQLTEAK